MLISLWEKRVSINFFKSTDVVLVCVRLPFSIRPEEPMGKKKINIPSPVCFHVCFFVCVSASGNIFKSRYTQWRVSISLSQIKPARLHSFESNYLKKKLMVIGSPLRKQMD